MKEKVAIFNPNLKITFGCSFYFSSDRSFIFSETVETPKFITKYLVSLAKFQSHRCSFEILIISPQITIMFLAFDIFEVV